MKKIEFSVAAIMSLSSISTSAADEENKEVEPEEEQLDAALEMSDEEFEKMTDDEFEALDNETETEQEESNLGDEETEEEETEAANEEEEQPNAEGGSEDESEEESETEDKQPSDEELLANSKVYEETYNALFGSPVKGGGREVQVRNAEHARNLMEMGIDYSKKMEHMKPHMRALRTLEKEGLLENEDMFNLLLEAKQGNPDAIKRLIGDNKLDAFELSPEEGAETYKPQNQLASQEEVNVNNALQQIRQSPAYEETLDVMTKTFDSKSKEILSENPSYITSLNQDIESGVYKKVMEAVQYQRDMKMIPEGTSDIEAYIGTVKQIAQYEQQQYAAQQSPAKVDPVEAPDNTTSKRSTEESRKRKTGMSTSRSSKKKKEPNYDPLSMSDEDFMKMDGMSLL